MRHPQRRVKKLSLASNSESTLNGDLLALQDAFNIASMNGVPPNGLLLVRRLELDTLSARASSQNISDIIDKKVKNLCYHAVCVDEQDAGNANVVWFSDALNAVFRLIDMVCKQRQVSAWYWPLLFDGYKPAMSLSDALLLVSREGEHQHSPLALMAAVIQHQVEQGEIDQTLAAITPQLARTLLAEGRFFPHAVDNTGHHPVTRLRVNSLSEGWKQALKLSLLRWGNTDVRSQWMAVNALVNQNPALLDSGRLLMLAAESIVEQVQHMTQASGRQSADRSNASDQQIRKTKHNDGLPGQTAKDLTSNTDSAGTASDFNRQHTNNSSPSTTEELCVDASKNETQSGEATIEPPSERQRIDSPDVNNCGIRHAEPVNRSDSDASKDSDHMSQETGFGSEGDSDNDSVITKDPDNSTRFAAVHSHAQSGFLFVVSILQALNIDECLKLNPELAMNNLPMRVIRQLAQRFNIDQRHPLLQCILQITPENEAIERFVCPQLWVDLLAFGRHNPLTLHRYMTGNNPGHCVITDHHHKLLLFAGDILDLPEWMNHHRIVLKHSPHRSPELADIETTVILLINRFLNRYASSALTGLINRPGRIVHTRTHLDVMFDQDQVDINIRRAGLDIDPGWVSWLGRVVQYHYVSGD